MDELMGMWKRAEDWITKTDAGYGESTDDVN